MRTSILITLFISFLITPIASGQCGQNYDREVRRIVKTTEKLPHEKTRIVFAGSSTFRLWDNMAESFTEYEVVNAGIGGSCFDDLYRYKEELISGTKPDILVIYEGDNDIVHVSGSIDPIDDILTINTELALADMESVEKQLYKAQKNAKTNEKLAILKNNVLNKVKIHLDNGEPIRTLSLEQNEMDIIRELQLLTAKPIMYIANIDEDSKNNKHLMALKKLGKEEGSEVIEVCAAIESEIALLYEQDKGDFLLDLGLAEPGLNRFIRGGYELLGLQTFFTAGPKEVRAWTTKKNAAAPKAAAEIHTDFERGFIRAEVVSYSDFIEKKGEQGAKEAGVLRLEGKEYIVQEGDIMHFRFNV